MTTKFERALTRARNKAKDYIELKRTWLSKGYCMSNDQMTQVQDAYYRGFLDGVNFK